MTTIHLARAVAIALLGLAVTACGGGDSGAGPVLSVDPGGSTVVNGGALGTQLDSYPIEALSTQESDSLAFMREEEQLAHDVYALSARLWNVSLFSNIRDSEATHTAAVKLLLDRYRVADPRTGLAEGQFQSPLLQSIYDALAARSRLNTVEALKVGAEIEELDIRDLMEQQTRVDNADILMVYANLEKGSRNHLRAFTTLLAQQGVTYRPQYLTPAQFDAIVGSPMETGR